MMTTLKIKRMGMCEDNVKRFSFRQFKTSLVWMWICDSIGSYLPGIFQDLNTKHGTNCSMTRVIL